MAKKILLRLGPDRFLEIVDLKKVWVDGNPLGHFSLLYSDANNESNTIYCSENKEVLLSFKKMLETAYNNGELTISL